MSTQKIELRDGTANLDIAIGQTSGALAIATDASRTGAITIGDAAQTLSSLTCETGTSRVTATGGDFTSGTTDAASTAYFGTIADAEVRLANGTATKQIVIGTAQTSGNLFLGANASRTGLLNIGSPTGTHTTQIRGGVGLISMTNDNSLTSAAGNVDVTATLGTATLQAAAGAALVDGGTTASLTAGTGDVSVTSTSGAASVTGGTTLTATAPGSAIFQSISGAASLLGGTTADVTAGTGAATVSSTSGAADVTGATTASVTAGTGAATVSSTSGAADVTGATTASVTAGTGDVTVSSTSGAAVVTGNTALNATSAGTVLLQSATDMTIQSSTDLTQTSVGNMILDANGTNELNATTTTLVKGGTGVTMTATTGPLDLNANSGAVTMDSSALTTITGGTGATMTATTGVLDLNASGGAVTIDSSTSTGITAGTSYTVTGGGPGLVRTTTGGSDLTVEAIGTGSTTYLGCRNDDTITRIAQGALTTNIIIGSTQTSGELFLASSGTRTGAIRVGSQLATNTSYYRGGVVEIDSGTGTNINATTGNLALSAGSGDIEIGEAQTTGDILIGTGSSRTAGAVIQIGDDGTITTDAVLIKGVSMHKQAGTFTPQLWDFTNSFTHTLRLGSYYIWGNVITYSFTLTWTSKGSASGNIALGGLPFSSAAIVPSGSSGIFGVIQDIDWTTGTPYICLRAEHSAAYMRVIRDNAIATAADFNASGTFRASITLPFEL